MVRPVALTLAAVGAVAVLASGCGGTDATTETTTASTVAATVSPPPVPTHLDVATPKQEQAGSGSGSGQRKDPDSQVPDIYKNLPPVPKGEMPPASAGTNGSYKPRERGSIDVQTAPGTDGGDGGQAILVGRTALAPPSAPDPVKAAVSAANQIVGKPYVWGGGHSSWYADGYDCSGSVSYALGGAGLLAGPMASGAFEDFGAPGPGRWITIYANESHVYAVIAGLRWDTVGDEQGTGPRWHAELPYKGGYTVRHPVGL